ncbi:MAG TPA: S8/S53 family peptidase, partial [Arenicellales bacterium]|nr:S8/S53 family peptidase [Arenicellales bacterium]
MADDIAGAQAGPAEPLLARGIEVGWRRRFTLSSGASIRIERLAPGGPLRRLTVTYWTPGPGGTLRPELAAVAGADCAIRLGRRLVYEPGSPQAAAVEHLDAALAPTGEREPLNPPVPAGADPGGVAVGLVDAGVNYLLPQVARRLARDESGDILGYDYWDLDALPFDANPARSPFFPQRHGTRTATLLLREAPQARLIPYRYPRPDMERMTGLIDHAAAQGVVIVNLSMGSNDRGDWQAFEDAARAHPDMLFVVSAGNN